MVGSLTDTIVCVSSETGLTRMSEDVHFSGVTRGGFGATALAAESAARITETPPASNIETAKWVKMDLFMFCPFKKRARISVRRLSHYPASSTLTVSSFGGSSLASRDRAKGGGPAAIDVGTAPLGGVKE